MAATSFVVKTMTVEIGTASYECDITGLKEVPNTPVLQTATACPDGVQSDVGQTTWTLDISANVSQETGSLWELLNDPTNWGKRVTATWAPDATNNPTKGRTALVSLVPPGGDFTVNSWATYQISLPIHGYPANKTIVIVP